VVAARPAREATDANGWTKSPLKGPPKFKAGAEFGQEVGLPNADADVVTSAVFGHLTDKKFDQLEVDLASDDTAVDKLVNGPVKVKELFVPDGKRALHVTLTSAPGATQWDWAANPAAYTVIDAAGTAYKPHGVYLTTQDTPKKFMAVYRAAAELGKLPKAAKATLGEVTLVYLLPKEQKGLEIRYNGMPEGLWLEE
jgi:hypothetical protein